MPRLNVFGSDSPLNFTLLERPYASVLKQSCRTGLTSARGIPVPLIDSKWWSISRLLVDGAFDSQHYSRKNDRHYHSVATRIYTGSCTELCSYECARSASESTCGLTQVRASVRAFRLYIDEQLVHPVEHRCTNLRGNTELDSRELVAALLPPKSAVCVAVEVHMLSTSRPHSTITTVLCPAFKCGTRGKECTSALSPSGVPVR